MPIYEFKCLKCDAFFEVIVKPSDDEKSVGCPECQSREFQRVVSKVNYTMGTAGGSSQQGVSSQTRNCSSGSCTTYTVPGDG